MSFSVEEAEAAEEVLPAEDAGFLAEEVFPAAVIFAEDVLPPVLAAVFAEEVLEDVFTEEVVLEDVFAAEDFAELVLGEVEPVLVAILLFLSIW